MGPRPSTEPCNALDAVDQPELRKVLVSTIKTLSHLFHLTPDELRDGDNRRHLRAELAGRRVYAGLDLAAKLDLTVRALVVPDGLDDGRRRCCGGSGFPRRRVSFLDKRTNGRVSQWADGGWMTVTPGDVID